MLFTLNLSAPKESVMGKALECYHYGVGELDGLLYTTGYPHNGGSHTLTVTGNKEDLLSWLDLFLEEYPSVVQEIDALKKELSVSTKRHIKLSDLKRKDLDGKDNKWFNVSRNEDHSGNEDRRLTSTVVKLTHTEHSLKLYGVD